MAKAKKAVLRAKRRPWPGVVSVATSGALDYAPAASALLRRGVAAYMANITSQEKRMHRAERERLENRRRTSQVKTWFRKLESAVGNGDSGNADQEYRNLVSRIDKAVKSGALHRNNGARKKARAARIRSRLS